MTHFECVRNDYLISTDNSKLDIDMIHSFLTLSIDKNAISLDIFAFPGEKINQFIDQ
jgi:hypothetical protein